MIKVRHRILAGAVLSPLLWGLACSPPPDPDVKNAESAVFVPGTLQLTLTSLQGSAGPSPPFNVSMAFANLTAPAGSPNYPTQTNLGQCSSSGGCADIRPPTVPWTKSFSSLGQTLPFAATLKAQSQDFSGTLFGCFNFGLNTTTNKLVSLPYNPNNCLGGTSGNNASNTLTCTGSNCSAKYFLHGGSTNPLIVNFTYKVTPPANTGSGVVTPNYMITTVYYAPPGRMSNANYKSTTSVGTTTSVTKSFQASQKLTADAKTTDKVTGGSASVQITENHVWGTTQTDEKDVEFDVTSGYTINGQVDGVDHNYDEIWLLLSPQLLVSYSEPLDTSLPGSITWTFKPNQDGINNAIPAKLLVSWLNGTVPINQSVADALAGHGVTTNDYPAILAADPLATGTPNPLVYPNRYAPIGSFNFEPPGMSGNNLNPSVTDLKQVTGSSSTAATMESYSVGMSVSGGIDFDEGIFNAKLTQEETWTWTNSSSNKLSNGTTIEDQLTTSQPLADYAGPVFGTIYEDTIYKTYAFNLFSVCGGGGASAQLCNNPGGTPASQCVATLWGFEGGEPPAWNNSAETASVVSTAQAHSGTQSLRISASSDPTLAASVNAEQCFNAAGGGTMNLAGKTYSAWVFVPSSTSSYAGTSCRLRAFDPSFHESTLPSGTVRAPIPPGTWFQLSGVFPSTSTNIYELTVDCKLPTDWAFGDISLPATKSWYVDDIKVN